MQVQHEAQLLEGAPLKGEDFAPDENQSLDFYTLFQRSLTSIEHLACGSSNLLAAYLNNSKQVILFDLKANMKRERFPLKPCDKKFSKQSFEVRAFDFSPDGARLAVGQTDSIIYIYKLSDPTQQDPAANTGASLRPTITGKFVCSSPVTCLIWIEQGVVFGTQDGKVKLITLNLRSNSESTNQPSATKVINVYNSPKGMMPISLAFRSNILAVSFVDGTVFLTELIADPINPESSNATGASDVITPSRRSSSLPTAMNLIELPCPAYNLAIMQNNTLCCAGATGRISLYCCSPTSESHNRSFKQTETLSAKSLISNWIQNFELKEDVTALDYSPINEILAIATRSRLVFLRCEQETNTWQLQASYIEIANCLAPSGLAWAKDGCQLFVGTGGGSLQTFRCSWSKHSISEQLDICHIARNRVRINDRARNLLATYKTQHDIKRVNLLDNGCSVIIWTTNSLLLARLGQLQSELRWSRERGAKFCFDYPDFVLVHNISTRDLVVVKLGNDSPVYEVKLESICKSKVCVRQFPSGSFKPHIKSPPVTQRSQRSSSQQAAAIQDSIQVLVSQENIRQESARERFAFVDDSKQVLKVENLKTGANELIMRHDSPITWLSLSGTVKKIIFRDEADQLLLVELDQTAPNKIKSPHLLATSCSFAAWLPDSDILVAQSSHRIFIWYSLEEGRLRRNVETLDVRRYNVTGEVPLVDLSLASLRGTSPYPVITCASSNFLELSNHYTIQLSGVKVRFFTEIQRGQLEAAREILDKEDVANNVGLWTKLGWQAIDRSACDIAISVFQKTGYQSMVSYLQRCMDNPDELRWRLAMLKGDWRAFEEELEPEQVVAIYRRLNKWSRIMDYLSEKQQFRQRDLVEQEFKEWLASKGRLVEAAMIQSKSGDLLGALALLESNQRFEDAANLLVSERKSSLTGLQSAEGEKLLLDLAKDLVEKLVEKEKFLLAAKLCRLILNRQNQALELYLKAGAFESALELAQLGADHRLMDIEEQFADNLMQRYRESEISSRKALPAIGHYLGAHKPLKAARVALELADYAQALDALKLSKQSKSPDTDLVDEFEFSKSLGDAFLRNNDRDRAIQAFLLGEHHAQVVELFIAQGQFKEAYEVTLLMHSNDSSKSRNQFEELAEKFIANADWLAAEKIYLMLEQPEKAIQMHKRAGNHERLLELVREYQADQLESSLLLLAKELEAEGRLEEAEKYLLEAAESEWANVVRMYRLANRWADAYRVARPRCGSAREPLLVQLAYWWSKSMPGRKSAVELLKQLEVYDLVVEFCCESRNFQLAIELSEAEPDEKLAASLVRRYAAYLEEQRRFDRAEELLLRYGQLESAVGMYVDNDMHLEAIRVVEDTLKRQEAAEEEESGAGARRQELVELLNKTLVQCANRMSEEVGPVQRHTSEGARTDGATNKLQTAQQLYLRAQRPELAVQMYTERGRWQEAVQVAQRFAPQLLESVERALDLELAEDMGPIVAAAGASRQDRLERLSRTSGHSGTLNSSAAPTEQVTGGGRPKQDFLRSRAELKLLNGDSRATKQALGEFMGSLVGGGSRTSLIDELLAQLNRLVSASRHLSASHVKVMELSEAVIQHSAWTGLLPTGAQLQHWLRLRDLLATCLEPGTFSEEQACRLERRMLLAHYLTFHGRLLLELERDLQANSRASQERSLANLNPAKIDRLRLQLSGSENGRELVHLIGKLSLALLRYTDVLAPRTTYFAAGTWLLASGRREQAQFVWRRLLELADETGLDESASVVLQQAGIPPPVDRATSELEVISSAQLDTVRNWLLGALIERGAGAEPSAVLADLAGESGSCLICGWPVAANDQVTLADYQACGSEWRRLEPLSARLEGGRRAKRAVSSPDSSPLAELVAIKLGRP